MMEKFLKTIPIPMCGLILAILSLGNLLISFKLEFLGELLGILGSILMVLVLVKIIFFFEHVKCDLKNPVIASVAPTFTMGLMVLCTYLFRWFNIKGLEYFWLLVVGIHVILMIYFTIRFVLMPEMKMEEFYPSWFIVYCGCGVVSVTAGSFFSAIGRIIFWVALIFYFVLLPFVIYRVFIHRKFENHTLPLVTILAAPGSLCLTGYLSAFKNPDIYLVTVLLIVSQLMYLFVIIKLPKMLKIEFYPSYAAFTFPLVISATAITKSSAFYSLHNYGSSAIVFLSKIETLISFVVVIYVLIEYLRFIVKSNIEHKVVHTIVNDELDK